MKAWRQSYQWYHWTLFVVGCLNLISPFFWLIAVIIRANQSAHNPNEHFFGPKFDKIVMGFGLFAFILVLLMIIIGIIG